MKKTLAELAAASGDGTSMITMLLPPRFQLSRAAGKLTEELGVASNIKKTANRNSVKEAIVSAQAKLKLFKNTPPNGLAVFVGSVSEGNKERLLSVAFEPLKPLTRFLYQCDRRFHVDELHNALEDHAVFGFIVITGDSCTFATLSGTTKRVLQKLTVDLPNKHGRGGQSAPRFQRLRLERRAAYVKKVGELASAHFLATDASGPRVEGLVLAGAAEMKEEVLAANALHPKLRAVLLRTVTVAAGGELGLAQAIERAADALGGVRLLAEQQLLAAFNDELARGSARCVYGVAETLAALEQGAVATLLVHDGLRLAHPQGAGEGDTPLLDWLADHHREHGATLELVSTASEAGARFANGLGGIGGLLRYAWEHTEADTSDDEHVQVDAPQVPAGAQDAVQGYKGERRATKEPMQSRAKEQGKPPAVAVEKSEVPSSPPSSTQQKTTSAPIKSTLNPNAATFVPRCGA